VIACLVHLPPGVGMILGGLAMIFVGLIGGAIEKRMSK
jgi:hypothetical protein